MKIYCCKCSKSVEARLTDGSEIYPHRPDLYSLPYWVCDSCGNFVGCHHKTTNRTRPLGVIPTPEIKAERRKIHALIDPLWKSGKMHRKEVYKQLSKAIGKEYHTGEIRSVEDAKNILEVVKKLTCSNGG